MPASTPPWVVFGLLANKLLVIERLLLRKGGQRRQNRLITNSPEMIISQIQIQREAEIQTHCLKERRSEEAKFKYKYKTNPNMKKYKQIVIQGMRSEEAKSVQYNLN